MTDRGGARRLLVMLSNEVKLLAGVLVKLSVALLFMEGLLGVLAVTSAPQLPRTLTVAAKSAQPAHAMAPIPLSQHELPLADSTQ